MTDIAHSTQNPKRILANAWADALVPITAQQWRVFKASFAHLVTTGMATAIVMALFMFIFSDFIQQKMPQISPKAAESARFYFLALTIIFSGLKKITGKNYVERAVLKAIKNDIAKRCGVYSGIRSCSKEY